MMPKTQIFTVLTATLLVIGLFQLPKVIVKTQNKTLDTQISKSTETPDKQPNTSAEVTGHDNSLTQEDKQQVAKLKSNFYSQIDKQLAWADSLAQIFRKVNMWDSAAHYIGIAAKNTTDKTQILKAANAYYDAFGFAIKPDKAKLLAQKARAFYQKILDKEPNHAEAKVKMGMTYTLSENPMQGILMIREVLEKEPNNTLALMNLGLLSIQSKQYDKAIERFEKLITLEPQNFEAKIYLAESYANTNQKPKAIELLKKVQQEASDSNIKTAAADFLKQLNP